MKYGTQLFKRTFLLAFSILILATISYADTEPNDNLGTANALALNASIGGSLGSGVPIDGQDWYCVSTNADGNLTATANFTGGLSGSVAIFRKNGGFAGGSANGTSVSFTITCLAVDTIYIRVLRAGGSGSYTLSNSLAAVALANDTEPNDALGTAIPIVINNGYPGHLGYNSTSGGTDGTDFYQFSTNTSGDITANVDFGGVFSGSVALFTSNGGFLGGSANTTGIASFTSLCRAADTYYVRIVRAGGCGGYTVTVNLDSTNLPNDIEPNNSIATANDLAINTIQTGQLGYTNIPDGTDGTDYYQFLNPSNGNVTLSATFGGSLNGNVALFNKNGGFLGGSANGTGLVEFTANCLGMDTLFARIIRAGGCGSYEVMVSKSTLPVANDLEPNSSIATIKKSVQKLETLTGHLGYNNSVLGTDGTDYYYLISKKDASITFTVDFDSTMSGNVALFTKNGGFLGGSANGTGMVSFTASCLAEDTIIARIIRAGGCGSYVAYFDDEIPPFIDDIEPNGTIATAIPIAFGKVKYGHLGYSDIDEGFDGTDYYSFDIPVAPLTITASATLDSTLVGSIALFNSAGGFLGGSANGTGVISFTTTVTTPGTYYVRLVRGGGCGSYWIGSGPAGVPCVGPPQTLNVSNIKATTATLSWSPVPGAISYTVRGGLQGIGVNNYLVFERPIGAPTSLNAIILKPNKTYEWQVRAHCSQNDFLITPYSALNTFSTIGCDATTADTTSMITTTTARLNWTPTTAALGYEIVGSKVGGSIVTLNVSGGANSFFDVANLTPGDSYMWGVRVICNAPSQPSIKSPLSNIQTFTTLGIPSAKSAARVPNDYFQTWMVYPNPAQDEVNLMIGKEFVVKGSKAMLINMNGSVILQQWLTDHTATFDISTLSNGIYLVGIESEDGMKYMKRLAIGR